MKSAQQLARQAISQQQTSTHNAKPNLTSGKDKCTQQVMDNAKMLWGRMVEIYGSKWSRDNGEMPPTDMQSLWMIAIGKQTRHRIQVAVGKCIRRHPTWPPTIPEFVALCDVDAEELGLPDNETAWLEAQRKAGMASAGWSHLAIKQAVRKTGSYDIQKATTKAEQESVKKRFVIEYNSIAKAMANGKPLIESDRAANPDRYIERGMVERGKADLKEKLKAEGINSSEFSGLVGRAAIDHMKKNIGRKKNGN